MPNFSGSFSGRATSQTTISLDDIPNHDLSLLEVRGVQKTSDVNWDNAKITTGAPRTWSTATVRSAATSSTCTPTETATSVLLKAR